MTHNVIVYSKSDCIFCQLAEQYLLAKGVDFVEREVNTHPTEWEEAKKLSPALDRSRACAFDPRVTLAGPWAALSGCRPSEPTDLFAVTVHARGRRRPP
jgi:glycine/D-amino acid oxidase-like deaminating enzyme